MGNPLREVAGDVGDEVGGLAGEQADIAVGADLGDDRVRNGLAGDEVEIRRQRGIDTARIDRDEAGSGRFGDGDVQDCCLRAGGNPAARRQQS